MLEPLQVLTYKQPTIRGVEGVVVTLKRWPNECWRFTGGRWQEIVFGGNLRQVFAEFIEFEEKLGSDLL